jgi:hypothetical protein
MENTIDYTLHDSDSGFGIDIFFSLLIHHATFFLYVSVMRAKLPYTRRPNLKYLGNIGNDIFYNRSTTNPAAFAISATFS